jgi:hypothetical protein
VHQTSGLNRPSFYEAAGTHPTLSIPSTKNGLFRRRILECTWDSMDRV